MRSKTGRSLKKFLSLLLTLSMVLGMLPTFAVAGDLQTGVQSNLKVTYDLLPQQLYSSSSTSTTGLDAVVTFYGNGTDAVKSMSETVTVEAGGKIATLTGVGGEGGTSPYSLQYTACTGDGEAQIIDGAILVTIRNVGSAAANGDATATIKVTVGSEVVNKTITEKAGLDVKHYLSDGTLIAAVDYEAPPVPAGKTGNVNATVTFFTNGASGSGMVTNANFNLSLGADETHISGVDYDVQNGMHLDSLHGYKVTNDVTHDVAVEWHRPGDPGLETILRSRGSFEWHTIMQNLSPGSNKIPYILDDKGDWYSKSEDEITVIVPLCSLEVPNAVSTGLPLQVTYLTEAKSGTVTVYYNGNPYTSTAGDLDDGSAVIEIPAAELNPGITTIYAVQTTANKVQGVPADATLNFVDKTFDVTFYNGSDVHEVQSVVDGGYAAVPAAPVAPEGKIFGGWYAEPACTTPFAFDTAITDKTDVYAKWVDAAANHAVTFYTDSGSTVHEVQAVVDGGYATYPVPPVAPEGKIFGGWVYDDDGNSTTPMVAFAFGTAITGDTDVYAKWVDAATNHTVTFYTDNGTTVHEVQSVVYGGYPTVPADPVAPAGFTFGGWVYDDDGNSTTPMVAFAFGTAITGDTDVYAKWIPDTVKYTVTFTVNGQELKTVEVEKDGTIANAPFFTVPTGYDFNGKWYNAVDDTEFVFGTAKVTEDITLKAGLTAKKAEHNVIFKTNGSGVYDMPESFKLAETATYELKATDEPGRDGYTFVGWSTVKTRAADAFDPATNVGEDYAIGGIGGIITMGAEDIVLYAIWLADTKYTVSFVRQEADATATNWPIDIIHTNASGTTVPYQYPVRAGYTFQGWDTASTANTVVYEGGDPVIGDATLYAVWQQDLVDVTLDNKAGSDVTVTGVPVSNLDPGDKVTFTVTLANESIDPASLVVTANGVTLSGVATGTPLQYSYSFIANVNTEVVIGDVTVKQYKAVLPTGSSFNAWFTSTGHENMTEISVVHGGGYNFKVEPVGDYRVTAVYVNGEKVTADSDKVYKVTNVTCDQNIRIEMEEIEFYTVTYIADDFSISLQVEEKTDFTNLEAPEVTGYTFSGWYSTKNFTDGTQVPANDVTGKIEGEKVLADVVVYGKYIPNTYTISYNLNTTAYTAPAIDGVDPASISATTTKTYGQAVSLLTTVPKSANYDFMGWALEANGPVVYAPGATFSNEITGNMTLYAIWAVKTYNVYLPTGTGYTVNTEQSTNVPYNGSFTFTVTVDRGYVENDPTVKVKVSGSSTDAADVPLVGTTENPADKSKTYTYTISGITADQYVTITVTTNTKYQVTFKYYDSKADAELSVNGETIISTTFVEYGYPVSQPVAPSVPGYTFDGWYKADMTGKFDFTTEIVDTTTIYAKMDPIEPEVKLMDDETGWELYFSTSDKLINSKTYKYGEDCNFYVEVKEGFNGTPMVVGVNGEKWEPGKKVVTTDSNGAIKGELYSFQINNLTEEEYNVVVSGVERRTVNVTYNGNAMDDVKGVPSVQKVNYYLETLPTGVTNTNIINQKPTRVGYSFEGWSTNPNATTAEFQPNDVATFTVDTTLYAVWEASDLSVTLEIKDANKSIGSIDFAYEGDEVVLDATLTADAQGTMTFYKKLRSETDDKYIAIGTVAVNGGKVGSMTVVAEDYIHDYRSNSPDNLYRWLYKVVFTPANEEGFEGCEAVDNLRVMSKAISWVMNKAEAGPWTDAQNELTIYNSDQSATVTQMEANTVYWLKIPSITELDGGKTTALTVGEDYVVEWQYKDPTNDWVTYTTITDSNLVKIDAEYAQYSFRALVKPADNGIYTKAAKYTTDGALMPDAYMDYLISEPTLAVDQKETETTLVILGADSEDTVEIEGITRDYDAINLAQFEGQTITLKATVTEKDSTVEVTDGFVKFYRKGDTEPLNTTQIAVDKHGVATFEVAVDAYNNLNGDGANDKAEFDENIDVFYAVYEEKHETWATSTSNDASVYIKSTQIKTPVIDSVGAYPEGSRNGVSGKTATGYKYNLTDLLAGVEHKFQLRTGNAMAAWSVVALDGREVDAANYDITWIVKTGDNEQRDSAVGATFVTTDNKVGDEIYVELTAKGDMTEGAVSKKVIIGEKQDVTVEVVASDEIESTDETDVYQLNEITLTATVEAVEEKATVKPTGVVAFYYQDGTNWVYLDEAELAEDTDGLMKASIDTTKLPVTDKSNTKRDVKITAVYQGDATFTNSATYTPDSTDPAFGAIAQTVGCTTTDETVTVYSSVVYVSELVENVQTSGSKGDIYITSNGSLVANEPDVVLELHDVYTLDKTIDLSKLTYGVDYTVQWQILNNASNPNYFQKKNIGGTDVVYFGGAEQWSDVVGETGISYTIGAVAQDAAYRAEITVLDTPIAKGSYTEVDQGTVDVADENDGRKVYYSNVLVVGAGQATVTTAITTSANNNPNEEGIVEGETVTIHTMVAGAALVTPISKLTVSINDQVIAEETNVNGYTAVEWKPTAPGYYTLKVEAESNNGYAPQTIERQLIVRDDNYTLTATDVSKVYNGKAQGIDWSLTGIGIEDTLAQQSVVVYYYDKSGNLVEPTQAGTYTYELILPASAYWTATAKDGEAGSVKMEKGTFTIEQRKVEIADLVAQAKVYDGNKTANLVEIVLEDAVTDQADTGLPTGDTGVINGDSVAAYGDGVLTAAEAGVEQTLSADNVKLIGDDAKNYQLVNGYTEPIYVQRNQIKGSIAAATYKFGTKQIPADDIIMIQQNGDAIDYVVTYYYHSGDGVEKVNAMNWKGMYTVIAAPADQNNYKGGASQVVYVADAAVDATPTAPVSTLIVLSNTAEVFGSNSGVKAVATNGTAVTVEYYVNNGWTTTVPANAGRYMVKATSGADTTYGIYTVAKAHPVLKLTAADMEYNSARYNGTVTLTGGTAEYYTYTGGTIQGVSYDAPIDAGSYVVTAHVGETDNYTAHEVSANFVIEKKALTITADDLQRWQYGAIPDMVATFDGLADQGVAVDTSLRDVQIQPEFIFNDVDGDNQPNYNNAAMDQVGLDYEIKPVNALARNYEISYVPGNFSVTKEDPRAALAIHGMIDNADLNTNIAYYGDVIQLYAYGNYAADVDSNNVPTGTGVYNPSSLIKWESSDDVNFPIDEETGLLQVNGVGTFTVTLTRGSGDAAISTKITITALKQEVKVVVPNDDKVFNNTELPHEGTLSARNGKGNGVTAAITKGNVTRKPIGSVYETGVVAGTDTYYQSETYRGLFTVNDREVVVKPNEISVVYGNTLGALSCTEENTATLPALKSNIKLASIRDAYVNLDEYDGYEILVTGTEELNYNVKYVTDQAAADVKVTALDLTVYTGTLDEEVGKTSGSPNYPNGYPANGEVVDPAKVLDDLTARVYGEPNWVMVYKLDKLIEGDSLADLLAFNAKLVNYTYGIDADANVEFGTVDTYLDGKTAYSLVSNNTMVDFGNYTEFFTNGIQNVSQRPVDLKLTNEQTKLNIYFADILNDAQSDVIEANLLAIILKNIEAIKPASQEIGGLAELLNHNIGDLQLNVEDVAFTNGQKTFTAHVYVSNPNYYLYNGKDCTNDNGSGNANKSDRCFEIEVNIMDQRLTVQYNSLTNTSASITLFSGSVPTYASGDVTFYVYKYVSGQENYSWYTANETAVRTKVMTKDNYRTGRYNVNFEYIPNDTYRVFAVASGYTIID